MNVDKGFIYAVATADTKGRELNFVRDLIVKTALPVKTVDLSTHALHVDSAADITPQQVAACHPEGASAVFCGDRGKAIAAMALAFERFLSQATDVAGIIGLGGSGGTALITPAMQMLPIGIPKIMVSTMASGDISGYIGASDISMIYSVTDVAGLNRISRQVLGNAAHQMAGAVLFADATASSDKPALGLTMFGVTTPCIQNVSDQLEAEFDCLVFHATGSGGRAMEKLIASGMLDGVLDLTTTEVCDLLFGGVLACGEDRFDAIAHSGVPCVLSCGALDMVNFGARASVPARYADRLFYEHNAQVTLMRTTPEENVVMAKWIAAKLNRCQGEIRFLLPEGGFSALDALGQPFWNPQANDAFIRTLEAELQQNSRRQLIRLPYNINDPLFANEAVGIFRQLFSREI